MSATDNATAQQGASAASKKRFTIRMVTVLIGGMFLDGYILGIIGPVSGRMAEDLQLDLVWQGLIAAGALIGILVGSPLGGWAADKYGRKPIFTPCSRSRRACSSSSTHLYGCSSCGC